MRRWGFAPFCAACPARHAVVASLARTLVPSPALCAHPPVPALRPVPKAFKPFGPPALVQQAPPAILLAAVRRFRGPVVFLGPRTSSRLGATFWPSGLTLRSSGLAFSQPLTLAVSRHENRPTYFCCCGLLSALILRHPAIFYAGRHVRHQVIGWHTGRHAHSSCMGMPRHDEHKLGDR